MVAHRISKHGTSFATRQRARELVGELRGGSSVELDFSGVAAASPSFIDELIGQALQEFETVTVECLSDSLTDLFERLIDRRPARARIRILAVA